MLCRLVFGQGVYDYSVLGPLRHKYPVRNLCANCSEDPTSGVRFAIVLFGRFFRTLELMAQQTVVVVCKATRKWLHMAPWAKPIGSKVVPFWAYLIGF